MINLYNKSMNYNCLATAIYVFALLLTGCNNEELPTLTTVEVSNITQNSVVSGGDITDDGGSAIIERGVCWNMSGKPIITDNKTSEGVGLGIFTSTLTNLNPNTSYYIRAYASNGVGISYGNEISFVTAPSLITETYTDNRDGKIYKSVKIGEQWWMTENLAYLPQVSPANSNSYTKAMYYVNNYLGTDTSAAKLSSYYQKYGVLYNWLAAKEACPTGWHLPSLNEWNQLINYISEKENIEEERVGYYLRSRDGWYDNSNGLDLYGFMALPGGSIVNNVCYSLTTSGSWWTSTMDENTKLIWYYYIYYVGENNSSIANNGVSVAFSVRCVKD